MKILIAIPCMDTVPVPFAESLLNLDKPEGTKVCFKSGSLVYDARNLLSITAIKEGFELKLEDGQLSVVRPSDSKEDKSLHGLYRALIYNKLDMNNLIQILVNGQFQ